MKLEIVNVESTNYTHSTIKEESTDSVINNLDYDKNITTCIKVEENNDIDEIQFDDTDFKCEEVYFSEPKISKKRKKVKEKEPLTNEDIYLNFVENNIRRIDMSKTEVLSERNNDKLNSSYASMKYKCTHCIVGFDFEEIFKDHMEKKHNKVVI